MDSIHVISYGHTQRTSPHEPKLNMGEQRSVIFYI